jgi:hypothetical protein
MSLRLPTATMMIEVFSSMKITRLSPIRSRQPARPLSRFTSPDPLVAYTFLFANVRRQFQPLAGRRGGEGDLLNGEVYRV